MRASILRACVRSSSNEGGESAVWLGLSPKTRCGRPREGVVATGDVKGSRSAKESGVSPASHPERLLNTLIKRCLRVDDGVLNPLEGLSKDLPLRNRIFCTIYNSIIARTIVFGRLCASFSLVHNLTSSGGNRVCSATLIIESRRGRIAA